MTEQLPNLTHVGSDNKPKMVNVGDKEETKRSATAEALIELDEATAKLLRDGCMTSKKGPVFDTAIIAGTMAVKQTANLIPFCHPLMLEDAKLSIDALDHTTLRIRCTVAITGKTGVEMEALTGASVAALTVYDMCKAASRHMVIRGIRVVAKSGGKSDFDLRQNPH